MHQQLSRLLLVLLGTGLLLTGTTRSLVAADDKEDLAVPFITFNVASIDRATTDIAWMFNSIQRSDMNDLLSGLITQHADDLKGFDRTRPQGLVLFLDTQSLPPRPVVVGYAPVENVQVALQTLARPIGSARPVVGRTDEFELVGNGEGDGVQAVVRIIGSYAYITPRDTADVLGILPNIEPTALSLASRYDAALTVQVKAIPQGVRQVFVNFLRAQAEIELQRRDEEPEEQYLVRRANGISGLELIEQVALQGEDLTIGWNAEPEKHSGYLDLILNATPDSEFAQFLSAVASKPSMFAPLRSADRPLTVNISWVMNKREQTLANGMADAVKVALSKALPELAVAGGPIEQMHSALQATFNAGHFDLFLQFHAASADEFVLLGGFRLAGAQAFGTAFEQFLQGVTLKIAEGRSRPGGLGRPAAEILINADAHQGVRFHKITPDQVPADDERLYGGKPDVYLGTSSRALWFAVGGNDAMPSLRESLDLLLNTPPAERAAEGNVPVSVTVRVAPWLELPAPEIPAEAQVTGEGETAQVARRINRVARRNAQRARESRDMAHEAFSPTDSVRIEGRPTESGFRTRIHLDEGFVKLLGLIISREYDRSQL